MYQKQQVEESTQPDAFKQIIDSSMMFWTSHLQKQHGLA